MARLLQRALLARNAFSIRAARALSRAHASALQARRSYATTASATKPTATVKRAVKAAAAKKPAPKKPAATATKAKRTTKVAAKKTTRKKAVAKKTAAKKPAAAKKAAKKPAKKLAKKVPTPEQKEKAAISELRKKALKAPSTPRKLTGVNAYIGEQTAAQHNGIEAARESLGALAQKWKTLTPAEHEHYNHLANEKSLARQAEYKAWIESHTPDEIRVANNARARLRAKLAGSLKSRRTPAHTEKLVDDRRVKRVLTSFVVFTKDRYATEDFKGIKIGDAAKLISNEWKALSASEKKKYEDAFLADRERYARESASP